MLELSCGICTLCKDRCSDIPVDWRGVTGTSGMAACSIPPSSSSLESKPKSQCTCTDANNIHNESYCYGIRIHATYNTDYMCIDSTIEMLWVRGVITMHRFTRFFTKTCIQKQEAGVYTRTREIVYYPNVYFHHCLGQSKKAHSGHFHWGCYPSDSLIPSVSNNHSVQDVMWLYEPLL